MTMFCRQEEDPSLQILYFEGAEVRAQTSKPSPEQEIPELSLSCLQKKSVSAVAMGCSLENTQF